MPYATIEIRQLDNDLEPLFQVWIRSHINVKIKDQPNFAERKLVRQPIGEPARVAPPARWPIPADHNDNLASAWEWYIEEFAIQQTPVTKIRAQHVRKAFYDWGEYNFQQLFNTADAVKYYYPIAETALSHEITVEIHAFDAAVLAWPWEGLVDGNREFLGQIMAFERRVPELQEIAYSGDDVVKEQPLNVLLVTARRVNDVDYRLVGRELATITDVTLLNPPTLENLRTMLADESKSWDVLHFDCHGGYGSVFGSDEQGFVYLGDGHGGLVPITGTELLEAFGEGTPQHIFLNACRSAKSEITTGNRRDSIATILLKHPMIRDVTAMAYNLSVDAVKLVLGFYYAGLINRLRVSVGLQNGRLMMVSEPYRTCIGGKVLLQDWMVPVIYLKQEASFDPVHDRAYFKGQFKKQRLDGSIQIRFVGHDELFFFLDHHRNKKSASVFTIYGLLGQGKTAFLDEYCDWLASTGDNATVIRIDIEKIRGNSDVLKAIFDAMGLEKESSLSQLAAVLNARPYLVILDHMPSEPGSLVGLLDLLTGEGGIVLTAGRVPLNYKGAVPLTMTGLEEEHRWQFFSELIELRRASQAEVSSLEVDKDLAALIAQCDGHPATMYAVLVEYESGISVTELTSLVKNGSGSIGNERFLSSLATLNQPEVQKLLGFLPACGYIFERTLIAEMFKNKYGDKGIHWQETGIKALQEAGLLGLDDSLHPLFVGNVLNMFRDSNLDEVIPHLLQSIRRIISIEDRKLPLEILLLAYSAAVKIDRKLLILLHPAMTEHYITERRWTELEELDNQILDLLIEIGNLDKIAEFFFLVSGRALAWRQETHLIAWLELGKVILLGFSGGLRDEFELGLLYEQAKLAQLQYRLTDYEVLLQQVEVLGNSTRIKWHADNISFDKAELAAMHGDWMRAESILEQLEDSPFSMNSYYHRLKSEVFKAKGWLDDARFEINRALIFSRKERNRISLAMNMHSLGELEALDGDFEKAKAMMTEAALVFEDEGDRISAGVTYNQLGKHYYAQDLFEEAADLFINSAICFQSAGELGRFETVSHNYSYMMSILNAEFAGYLAIKWNSQGLPQK